MMRFGLPLAIFLVVAAFLYKGLALRPREIPSPLIGKPAPAFSLQRLDNPAQTVSEKDLQGQVWILNVWASWCVSCLQEHPLLVEFSKSGTVPVYGLNYKDQKPQADAWLGKHGNPYTASFMDPEGRVGIDYGVYGVPETYVIDHQGIIRFKQIGPVDRAVLKDQIVPLVKQLQARQG
jgi:cytochrome c biogenesis protein CcmG, thiol:disulfide interchange protein DsbE